MIQQLIRNQLNATLSATHFTHLGTRYGGKVRDTYAAGDKLILITSDRISAFDHILRQTIPFKGQVLNGVATYFFDQTKDIVQNHILDVPDQTSRLPVAAPPFPSNLLFGATLQGTLGAPIKAENEFCVARRFPMGFVKTRSSLSPF